MPRILIEATEVTPHNAFKTDGSEIVHLKEVFNDDKVWDSLFDMWSEFFLNPVKTEKECLLEMQKHFTLIRK